jgi:hypothetical protein
MDFPPLSIQAKGLSWLGEGEEELVLQRRKKFVYWPMRGSSSE